MDLERIVEALKRAEKPSKRDVRALIDLATPIFAGEPNVLQLSPPITACGDSHGQLFDVLHLFELAGNPPGTQYVFLGDYVDRGYYSVELLLLLLCLKIQFPDNFFLLRGNHETRGVNEEYGFYDEITAKYDSTEFWPKFNDLFDLLPSAAVIDSRLFCIHGGLDPGLENIDQIRELDRNAEPELESILGGILWADPSDEVTEWERSNRRAGFLFNEAHVSKFLEQNHLQQVVRRHEMADGYELMFGGKLVTIWSAPNYCYMCGNRGGVLRSQSDIDTFLVYDAMPDERRTRPPPCILARYFQ